MFPIQILRYGILFIFYTWDYTLYTAELVCSRGVHKQAEQIVAQQEGDELGSTAASI